MTEWSNANVGCSWAVKLDVRDLGGHLDVTQRALAGTLGGRVKEATSPSYFSWSLHLGVPTDAWDGVFQILACGSPWM